MTERINFFTTVELWLSFIRARIELRNSLNLQDINVHAENFFRDFLNLLYGYKLGNANYEKQNVAVIDLFDDEIRLVIQVTSDNSSEKVHDTINGFNKGNLFPNYDRLIMLVITSKKDFPKVKFGKVGETLFDKKYDIIDLADLLKDIENFELSKLEEVKDFIEKEVALKAPLHKRKRESNEVESIMKLIEYLSGNSSDGIDTTEQEPNPEFKILFRFADYSDYLTKRFQELAYLYKQPLETAANEIGLDRVKVLKIQLYLKGLSNRYLNEKNGNPQEAINSMVVFFNLKLSEAGFVFDEIAAEFYLIDELINCNVFPNP